VVCYIYNASFVISKDVNLKKNDFKKYIKHMHISFYPIFNSTFII